MQFGSPFTVERPRLEAVLVSPWASAVPVRESDNVRNETIVRQHGAAGAFAVQPQSLCNAAC